MWMSTDAQSETLGGNFSCIIIYSVNLEIPLEITKQTDEQKNLLVHIQALILESCSIMSVSKYLPIKQS